MEYFAHLKEKFPFYLSSGIICSILVFLMVVINSYNGHLEVQLERVRNIVLNKNKIIKQVREIDAFSAYIREEFGLDVADVNSDAVVFDALDGIKTTLPDSTIRISRFEGTGRADRYRVNIEVPIKDYSMLVHYFQYIESFRIPKYKITNFSLRKGKPGQMMLYISGNFQMPAI